MADSFEVEKWLKKASEIMNSQPPFLPIRHFILKFVFSFSNRLKNI